MDKKNVVNIQLVVIYPAPLSPIYRPNKPADTELNKGNSTITKYIVICYKNFLFMIGKYGWGGIRTHGAFTHASFQDWYLKPLDHPSI